MSQNFYFDIQRFATGTAVKIGGVVNNVEVGDTFTVDGAKYTVLAVEKDSVTAIVEGTPAENLGKQIVIGDGKSIDGATYQTTALEDTDSDISAKYTYKLDIDGNSVFVTVFDNAIESVTDSGGNSLSATGDNYTVNGKDFSLALVNGIPHAAYDEIKNVAATLDTKTYSFSVDSKPVEVVVKNDAISSVTVDSEQVGTAAGIYSVGEKSLNVSYADGNFSAETAAPVSTEIISSVATYQVGDTKVTVTDGNLSTSTAKVNGHNATLTYSADTKKITASYTVTTSSTTTTGDPNTYIVTLPDDSEVKVKVEGDQISTVTQGGQEIQPSTTTDGYSVESGGITYNLTLKYNNALTATATWTINQFAEETFYTVSNGIGSSAPSTKIKVVTTDGGTNLYQDDSQNPMVPPYSVTLDGKTVYLTYDTTNGLKEVPPTNVVDLSNIPADRINNGVFTAQNGEILTGTPQSGVKIKIAAGATVTLRGVTITGNNSAGITCLGTATIILEGTNTVTGDYEYAGIQAGATGTTLTINGYGTLNATCGDIGGAGIGSGYGDACGNIVIESGTVEAMGGGGGAGIGSGYGYGGDTSTCGNITISGGTVTATGVDGGAGIGSGNGFQGTATCGAIEITGGTIEATGGVDGGAGIGSGLGYDGGTSTCGTITISKGTIIAKGDDYGAGIGSGYGYGGGTSTCGAIEITGGTIEATGGVDGGAGIGSGLGYDGGTSNCGTITIEDTVTKVTATKGDGATDSVGVGTADGGQSTCGTVTIPNTGSDTIDDNTRTYTGANTIELSTLNDNYTVQTDGAILTCTGNAFNHKVIIPAGYTVTLSGVTITGSGDAGIQCLGTATIILEGTNKVTGADGYAGIQAGSSSEHTLTITGTGTLNATGGYGGAGIGSGNDDTCGNISITGGVVTATGGVNGAGIGAGFGYDAISTCGAITISGGNITAKGSGSAAGIGSGKGDNGTSTCGNITISKGTVTATGGYGGAGIGAGNGGGDDYGTSTCGAITIEDNAVVTATGGEYGAGIGAGNGYDDGTSECQNISITGGTITATGGSSSAGIGSGFGEGGGTSTCVTVTIENTVTKLTATKGEGALNSVGKGNVDDDDSTSTCGNVTINGVENSNQSAEIFTYPVVIDNVTTQTATLEDGTIVTFTINSSGNLKYKIGNDETEPEITDGEFTFTVNGKKYTATVDITNNKVTGIDTSEDCGTANDQKTVSSSSTQHINKTFDSTLMTYTFAVDGKNVSVNVDSNGKMTYDGQAVTDNKIIVNGVEVTLNVEDNAITGATYLGKYSPVTDITSVDVYKAIIDGQTVSLIFDAKNQCNVEVNGKNYLLTKTDDGATYTSEKTSIGIEDSRIYLLEVDGEQHWINCTFDADGKLTAVTSDDESVTVDGTTIKFGDYTVEVSGTKNNLKTSATLAVDGEAVRDVEVNQLFTLSGIATTNGITLEDGVVLLTAANLDNQDVTIEGDGYTLALDKNYSPTTATPEHFEGNTYKSESFSDGYEISSDAKLISYVEETPATDLFTLSGVKTTDGITVKDGVVTLTAANLNGEDVTIEGDGYTLALDKNYSPTATTTEHFEGNIYKSESFSDGYEISSDAKSISYVSEIPATNLFTLSGVKSTKGITVENNVVTLTAANLNNQDAAITGDGYTLALADGIKAPTFDEGGWTLSGTTATYTSESNTDGYTLAGDAKVVTYTPAHDPEISLKVYGVKSLDGLSLSGTTVTVAASSLDKQTVTISKGYTLAIADDVEQPSTRGKYWTQLDEDTYLYTNSSTTAGYTLSNNKITYSDEFVSGEQYTIHGAAGTELISETDDAEDVEEDSLNRRKVVLIETDEHNPENKLAFYGEDYAEVTVGAGQDSLITYDGARSKVDMTNADNVTVVSFGGKVKLYNYDVNSGAVVLVQDVDNIVDAIKRDDVKLTYNEIQINKSSRVAINNSDNDSTVVKLVNYDGEKQLVGFTGINGGTLDMSAFNENALLKGNYSETSPETKRTGSTLKGGKNNDTLLAGSRDYVDGGEGKNEIYLTPYEMRYTKDGATIVSGGNSRNSVYNFHEGFNYDGDYVQVENLSDVNFKFENDGLLIGSENSRMKLKGIGVNSYSADAVSDFGAENPELILLTDGQTTLKTAVAKTDESILVTEKDGLKPNAFFGNRSGLNFSAYGGTVEVNLSDGTGALGGRDAIFSGINKIRAGDGFSTLIGSDETNTLIAGNGYTSLWGGAGNDKLFGRSGSTDKDGRTEFFYFAGDGRDVIYDFEFLTAENKNSGTADKIGVDTLVTKISCSGNDVVLQVNDSDENLTIKNAAGKTFQINDLTVKVDKNIVYDGLANLYIADGGNLVSVDSGVKSAEIWLDNSHETVFVGEIKTLDASAVDGKTSLAGNAFDNTIIAGNGDSSLWGGDFGNDLLVGGGGKNTFFYNFGNGNDTIQNAKAGDVVDLTNITLEQIVSADITDSGVELEFKDGGTLTVNGTNCEYRVAGTSYVVDNGNRKFVGL